MHVDELIREEHTVLIGKDGFEFVSAGGGINLIVDRGKLAVGNLVGVIAVIGFDGKLAAASEFRQDLLKLVLRQGEDDGNGLELSNDEKPARVGGMHDVSHIDETQSHASADGSRDVGVNKLQFCIIDGGLVRFNRA